MSIRGPGWPQAMAMRVKEGIQRAIAGDVKMGNQNEIDHIWIHPHNAHFLGLHGSCKYMFKIDGTERPFRVEVSTTRPKSVAPEAAEYFSATVDKNGWVVGERTAEEAARRPAI